MADVTVKLLADARQFNQAFAGAKATMQTFSRDAEQIGARMVSAGKALTLGVTLPLVALGAASVKAASDLEQSVGATESVFGRAISTVDRFARKSVESVGLSERAYRELAAVAGAQLQNLGASQAQAARDSDRLIRIGADLAATFGGTTAEAVQALGAAFRGEADPAERFGLRLNINTVNAKAVALGLAESTSAVDEHARRQALMALIVEQSAGALGQFARESDTLAVRQQKARAELENAAATIGAVLLPVVADAAGIIGDLARGFAGLPEPVQQGALALGGILSVAGPLIFIAGKIVQNWEGISKVLSGVANAARAAGPALGGLAIAGGITAGIILLADALGYFDDIASGVTVTADELANHLPRLRSDLAGLRSGFTETADFAAEFGREAANASSSYQAALDEMEGKTKSLVEQTRALADESPTLAREFVKEAEAAGLPTEVIEKLNRAIANSEDLHVRAAVAKKADAEALDAITNASERATQSYEDQLDAANALANSQLGLHGAMLNVESAEVRLGEVAKDNAETSLEYRQAQQSLQESILRAGAAAFEAAEDQAILENKTNTAYLATQAQIGTLEELKGKFPELAPFIQGHIDRLRAIPPEAITTADFRSGEAARGIEAYRRQIESLPTYWQTNLFASIALGGRQHGGPIPGPPSQAVPIMAHGGEYVLSADIVQRIKAGRPSFGASVAGGEAWSGGGGEGGVQTIVIPLSVGGRVVAEAVVTELNRPGGPKVSQRAIV